MNTPKTPEEIRQDHIQYVLSKYLKGKEQWKVYYNALSDEKLTRLLNDIKMEGQNNETRNM